MKYITQKLHHLYLNPDKNGFSVISILIQKKYIILIILSLFLISYPIINMANFHFKKKDVLQAINEKTQLLNQYNHYYSELLEKENILHQKDHNLIHINESIQKMAQNHHLQIDRLQWNLEQGKSLEIRLIHTSNALFNFINTLNQHPYLKFNRVNIIKSEQERKLELNAILVLTTNKE